MIVGIDPGQKIGVAVVGEGGLEHRCIVSLGVLEMLDFPPDATIVVGNGTGHETVVALLRERGLEPRLIDETNTTLEARDLYFAAHPPRGLARLLPKGLRIAPRPVDDYAAYAIVLRHLAASTKT
ncbi:MAG: hypothetical protein U5L04_15570 [Trueperaceae bacterium]|nr:hypothetical protein [Trueperaceae bacterium]